MSRRETTSSPALPMRSVQVVDEINLQDNDDSDHRFASQRSSAGELYSQGFDPEGRLPHVAS